MTTPAALSQVATAKEQIIFYTSEWKGERFPDGRPKIPDAVNRFAISLRHFAAGGHSSCPCLIVTERHQLLPRCTRAQTAKRRPATMTVAPSQKDQSPAGQS
jgi:hypothetical protein